MSVRLSFSLAIVAAAAYVGVAHADHFEPGVEAKGAVPAGEKRLKDAIALAKDPANKQEALDAFRSVAAFFPSSMHDCYLALAYLRVGNVTSARLAWDIAADRGGSRPAWCTGDLARQLRRALRGYVRIDVAVSPRDANITLPDNTSFQELRSVWWPAKDKHVTLRVGLLGYMEETVEVALVAPVTRVHVELLSIAPPPDFLPPEVPAP